MKALLKRVWYRFLSRRRPFRLTRAGWVFILYTIGVGAGAINTGNNLLYLIFGIFLGIILASGVLSDLSLWSLSVDLHFPPSAQSGQPNLVGLKVRNEKKWFPSFSVTVQIEGELRDEPIYLEKYIPIVYSKETVSTHFIFQPLNRGWFKVNRIKLATRFPFGILFKWWTYKIDSKETYDRNLGTVVFPNLLGLSSSLSRFQNQGDEKTPLQSRKGEGVSIFGVREFHQEDNPKRIHWRASAKRAFMRGGDGKDLLVREMEMDEKEDQVLFWPGLSDLSGLSAVELEGFIEYTASVVHSFYQSGKEAKLLLPGFRVDAKAGQDWYVSTMTFLALFESAFVKEPHRILNLKKDPFVGEDAKSNQALDLFQSYKVWVKEKKDAD